MRLLELRVLIRDLLLTEDPKEDLLKRWGEKSEDPVDVALARIGILPIPQGHRSSSTVGEGSWNAVKEVLFNGRRCVARYSTEKKEQWAMLDFVEFERMVDPKYAKHFPEVMRTFEIEVPGTHKGLPHTLYGTLGELLDPLPSALAHDLKHVTPGKKITSNRIDLFLNDRHARSAIISKIANAGRESVEELERMFDDVAVPLLKKISRENVDAVYLSSRLAAGMYSYESDSGKYMADSIARWIRQGVVPHGHGNDSLGRSHPSAKVREFVEFLQALGDAGMVYADLHTDNFMVRRSTGDLVVVDPGAFE